MYLFASKFMDEYDGICIVIVPKDHWEKERCLCDTLPDKVRETLMGLNYSELVESFFEPLGVNILERAIASLSALPDYEYSKELEDWL